MPLLRIKELRDMSPDNRTEKLTQFRTELVRLKTMIGAGGTVENPARVKALRKAIAKILTIEHEDSRKRKAEPAKTESAKRKAEPAKTESAKRKAEPAKTESAKRKKK